MAQDRKTIENINAPDHKTTVRADKYNDMYSALMKVLPDTAPGLSFDALKNAAKPHLSQSLFPNGKTSGWWAKTVQLDLEAKGFITRSNTKPLTFHKS